MVPFLSVSLQLRTKVAKAYGVNHIYYKTNTHKGTKKQNLTHTHTPTKALVLKQKTEKSKQMQEQRRGL